MNFSSLTHSSSIGSLLSNTIPRPSSAPNIEMHDFYMERSHKSEKKLIDFFGDEDIPFDITIKEIEVNGLKAMLQSKVPLCYFLYSLLEDFCSENLFFFLEALEFEKGKYSSREEQEENAVYIYNTYLSKKSCLEINIDEKVYNEIQEFIKNMNKNSSKSISKCFVNARNSVYQLMEGSFAKFQKSSTYATMKQELGRRLYNENDKLNAVSKLRDYLMKSESSIKQNLKENPESQIAISNAKHHEIISLLVHEFTKSILGINFNEKDIYVLKNY
ncbi:regulator of G protein signaling superfamily [Neocallimastix californiae]|uniref:Regulator of G protein signaling superfamily n=1 Tax=Neocallimastix californiae TaxID=1754190 RepID=A0A1Y2D428_9FUNG|nr:regulator of G protein signaling superfamily [Neocallimastix californiae]|eukprot:ORY54041.1 regulator of G protein signaling superfamily [Neocallimastix californiae]